MQEHAQPPGQIVLGYELLLEQDQQDWDVGVEGEIEGGELSLVVSDVVQQGSNPASQVDPQTILVDVLQGQPQASHGEQEEGPVNHALVVVEG